MKERVPSICGKFFNCEAVFLLVCIYDFCDFLCFSFSFSFAWNMDQGRD